MVKPPNAGCVVSAKPPTLTWMNVLGFEQTGAPNSFTLARPELTATPALTQGCGDLFEERLYDGVAGEGAR